MEKEGKIMTTQEAIKQLQTEHDLIAGEHELDGSQFAPALLEALAMAIEALEKQTPKKPKHVITNMGINGNFRRECPSCGWLMFERVTTKDASEPVVCRILNFCQSCGQRIDWGEL